MSLPGQLAKPVYIKDQPALEKLAQELQHHTQVAVDTESNSLYSYQERVCLIQFSTPNQDYLVDPLALDDLTCLADFFQTNQIEKIFHAAEYDLICMRRDFDFHFYGIFDTMVAARILGRKQVGLGALLQDEFGLEMDKKFQRANWGQRPLPEDHLVYAQLDTHYLIGLRKRLEQELSSRGLLALAKEDFARLCGANDHDPCSESKPEDPWRISGARDLTPEKAAVLLELCLFRDRLARHLDRPLFKVFGDQALLNVAEKCPQNISDLESIPGLSTRQVERNGKALLQAVQRGMRARPIYPNHNQRPQEAFLIRLDVLRDWRKKTGEKMGVPSDVVLPRDLMVSLAEINPQKSHSLAEVLSDVPWRYQHFGSQILELLNDI